MTVDLTNVDIYGAYSRHLDLGAKRANTHGGEFWTYCPWCGTGDDRFHVWPYRVEAEDNVTTHWCRICDKSGDVISFIEYVEHRSFPDACRVLGIGRNEGTRYTPRNQQQDEEDEAPPIEWMTAAVAFSAQCRDVLWSEIGKNALEWLRKRGFTDETIKRARLGYNPATRWDDKAAWGLQECTAIKKIWLPRGITIPWKIERNVWKISIRRPNPDLERDKANGIERPAKYIAVKGGSNGIYGIDDFDPELPSIITEGEFDDLILAQGIGNQVNVLATGSTGKGRCERWVLTIAQSPVILIGFDADEGGKKAMNEYWLRYLPHALPWQPWSKDINDMYLAGHDLKEWLLMGVELAQPAPITDPVPVWVAEEPITEPIPVVADPVIEEPSSFEDLSVGFDVCCICLNLDKEVLAIYDLDDYMYCIEHYPPLQNVNALVAKVQQEIPAFCGAETEYWQVENSERMRESILNRYRAEETQTPVAQVSSSSLLWDLINELEKSGQLPEPKPVVYPDFWEMISGRNKYVSIPSWLTPGDEEWDKLVARVGLKEAKDRRQVALRAQG